MVICKALNEDGGTEGTERDSTHPEWLESRLYTAEHHSIVLTSRAHTNLALGCDVHDLVAFILACEGDHQVTCLIVVARLT